MNPRGGCGCKVSGNELKDLLARASGYRNARGLEAFEDCGIIEEDERTLLFTNDISPLVGPDMFDAGRIAAFHSFSDIWACGGSAQWANITLIVDPSQPMDVAEFVLKGIYSACAAVGVSVTGGHTIYGPEAMAGLSVIGKVTSGLPVGKQGASIGDRLLISKPLGVGLALRAYTAGIADEQALREAMDVMTTPNLIAARAALLAGCHAMTDVTGFGLVGHLTEMLKPGHGAVIDLLNVPILKSVQVLPRNATDTRWIRNNYDYAETARQLTGLSNPWQAAPLFDPQTNGGLLVAAPEAGCRVLENVGFVRIGRIVAGESIEFSSGPTGFIN